MKKIKQKIISDLFGAEFVGQHRDGKTFLRQSPRKKPIKE